MAMAKHPHTPGPWALDAEAKHPWIVTCPVDGFPELPGKVCDVGYLPNARLIAAAPELLAAAELAMEGIEVLDLLIASIEKHGNYSVDSILCFLNQARCAKLRLSEAIAKAEGK